MSPLSNIHFFEYFSAIVILAILEKIPTLYRWFYNKHTSKHHSSSNATFAIPLGAVAVYIPNHLRTVKNHSPGPGRTTDRKDNKDQPFSFIKSKTHRPSCAVHVLPFNILREIFLLCLSLQRIPRLSPRGSLSMRATPLNVSQVCTAWRSAAVSIPQMWTNITMNQLSPTLEVAERQAEMISTLAKRSAERLRKFDWTYTMDHSTMDATSRELLRLWKGGSSMLDPILLSLGRVSSKWSSFKLCYKHISVSPVPEIAFDIGIQLNLVNLVLNFEDSARVTKTQVHIASILKLDWVPRLENLELFGHIQVCASPWFTTKTLKYVDIQAHSECIISCLASSLTTIIRCAASSLTILRARIPKSTSKTAPTKVYTLDKLFLLDVTFSYFEAQDYPTGFQFLNSFRLPNLHVLRVKHEHLSSNQALACAVDNNVEYSYVGNSSVTELVTHSSCSLLELSLDGYPVPQRELITILQHSPRLTHLTLRNMVIHPAVISTLTVFPEGMQLCPLTATLEFDKCRGLKLRALVIMLYSRCQQFFILFQTADVPETFLPGKFCPVKVQARFIDCAHGLAEEDALIGLRGHSLRLEMKCRCNDTKDCSFLTTTPLSSPRL